ncbi:MAG: hypothetical protein L0H53_04100 [Candidatus Nitrosocosmicus sp.]|nr:hypothetical protein [Candidatus Nitrosocosmicus sp.]MDN5866844.1 hypothetical protein [Candidatus Nitrosocosmicus sp.]
MNISVSESQLICEAKICGCLDNKRVVYGFFEPVHSLCIDKKQLILSQIQACRNLLKYTTDKLELRMVEKEIDELNAL